MLCKSMCQQSSTKAAAARLTGSNDLHVAPITFTIMLTLTFVYVVLARSTAQVVLVIHVIKNPFCAHANSKDADHSVH